MKSVTKTLTLSSLVAALALIASVALMGSCGKPGQHFNSTSYRLPWAQADGTFSFQNVEIKTLSDPEHFTGAMARILVEPGDGGDSLQGQNPQGHFVRSGSGVLVPSDFVTMQAVTAYAHQERLHDLDQKAGAGSVLSWPLTIGIEVKVMSYGQTSTNNAVYDAKLNSLLVVPYNDGALPIALNAGILGHEHFHFIFQSIVMSRVPELATQTSCEGASSGDSSGSSEASLHHTPGWDDYGSENEAAVEKTAAGIPPKIYNGYLLRSMNEGFADFWGWLYSQDDTFLSKSLPEQDDMRRLDSDAGRLPSEGLIRRLLVDVPAHPDAIVPEIVRAHNAYGVGSIYARYLRHLVAALVSGGMTLDDARFTVARALMASLPVIADRVSSIYSTGYLSPNVILAPLLAKLPALSSSICSSLEQVRASDDAYVKPTSCQAFAIPVRGESAKTAVVPALVAPTPSSGGQK